jgi:hypothetical protein
MPTPQPWCWVVMKQCDGAFRCPLESHQTGMQQAGRQTYRRATTQLLPCECVSRRRIAPLVAPATDALAGCFGKFGALILASTLHVHLHAPDAVGLNVAPSQTGNYNSIAYWDPNQASPCNAHKFWACAITALFVSALAHQALSRWLVVQKSSCMHRCSGEVAVISNIVEMACVHR